MRLAAIACLFQVGCVGAVLLPPSRTEVGSAMVHGPGGPTVGLRATTGAHWASGTTGGDVPVDVGIGYVYERAEPEPDTRAVALGSSEPEPVAGPRPTHGGYLEAAWAMSPPRRGRSWLGVRTEVLTHDGDAGVGASVRVQWELYGNATGAGADGGSQAMVAFVSHGTAGIGLFLDSGVRHIGGETSWVTSTGLTIRLPFIFAFGIAAK